MSYQSCTQFDLVCNINHDIQILRQWFTKHKLVISSKTRLMFHSLSSSEAPNVDISYHDPTCKKFNICANMSTPFSNDIECSSNCFKIEKVEHFKYLGVILDNKFNWLLHTNTLKIYLRSTLRKFYQLQKICSQKLLKIFYYAIFHSKLMYGITCWGGSYANKLQPLIVLQKNVIRKLCNVHRTYPSHNLFKLLQILPVRHLYFFKTLKTFFINFQQSINVPPAQLRQRRFLNVQVPIFRTTVYRNSYPILSCRLFNSLPSNIQSINTKNLFLSKVKSWLLNFNSVQVESLLHPIV